MKSFSMPDGFSVMLASTGEHDRVVAEIYCDGKLVAQVSQDRGLDAARVEFPGRDVIENEVCRHVDLSEFRRALEFALGMLAERAE